MKKNNDLTKIYIEKREYFRHLINNTLLSIQDYKSKSILSTSDVNICYKSLNETSKKLNKINMDEPLEELQNINDSFSNIFKYYGTRNMDDIIIVTLGKKYLNKMNENSKYKLIKQFFKPCSYKNIKWKNDKTNKENKSIILQKNKIVEDFMIVENAMTLDCFDLSRTSNNFYLKTAGIKVCLHCSINQSTMVVSGIVDNIHIKVLNNEFITNIFNDLRFTKTTLKDELQMDYERFINSLSLKGLLVYDNEGIYHRFNGFLSFINSIKHKDISQLVKEFISSDVFEQRKQIMFLLIKHNDKECQYLSYLLYDLLSSDNNNSIDTFEQMCLYDSLPWNIKIYFRDAMKYTFNYTNIISSEKNIPLEQQICLMKVSEDIKEKAMVKLKEIKSKSEDSGFKARQYLEGLLKIPFGSYKEEHILHYLKRIQNMLSELINVFKLSYDISNMCIKDVEIIIDDIKCNHYNKIRNEVIQQLKTAFTNGKQEELIMNISKINIMIKQNNLTYEKILYSGKKKLYLKNAISKFIDQHNNDKTVIKEIITINKNINVNNYFSIHENIININENIGSIKTQLHNVENVLDEAVFGHKNAKHQIERIIGQWVSGKKSGYCFGFEGPPGLGKTSLAKRGIAKCLVDTDGKSRPFSFIAIGGSSNGSILDGHSYTYVGSTWGKIVDALMTTKCMNPIIFIDELDKISKTENGKELIGVLTHLVDSTQNDNFQDKYFSGIPIDLSKVLFIFSYNDANLIDRILLDRIHRIKFDPLTVYEKITICKKFIIPELTTEINLLGKITMTDNVILYLIDNYTYESGVRKLKELFFDIINEINLMLLKTDDITLPYELTIEKIEKVFFVDKDKINHITVPKENTVGIVNGLWANSYGKGGIIPIESKFYPTGTKFELKLTGKQGDVMKESMIVARTLAWNYLKTQGIDMNEFKDGLHVHCPEGAVPKDGPSAGLAITLSLLSLLLNRKIKRHIGITGEINLQGKITAIGGLELKIIGGIKGGISTFLFPRENKNDMIKIKKRYDESIFKDIEFITIDNLEDAIDLVFI